MGAFYNMFVNSVTVRDFAIATFVLLLIPVTDGLNLGLRAGDLKRHSSPLVIKKVSRHSPVFININSGLPKIKQPLATATLLAKPSKKSRRSILSPLLLPPLVPKIPLIPLLPILPPILPPLLPTLPLIPPIPLVPSLRKPLKPLSVPILGKQKALETELKPIKLPLIKQDKKDDLLKKLLDLKLKGSLTTSEYIMFRKLLKKVS